MFLKQKNINFKQQEITFSKRYFSCTKPLNEIRYPPYKTYEKIKANLGF